MDQRVGRYALFAAALLLAGALGYKLRPTIAGETGAPAASAVPVPTSTPGDTAGWLAAGETAFAARRYPDAVAAYRRVTTLAPSDPAGWSALGEALVQSEAGIGPSALAAFRQALVLDRGDPRARYFLAVKRDLDSDHRGALADWAALVRDSPPGAPWVASVRALMTKTATREKLPMPPLPPVATAPVAPSALPGAPAAATAAIPGPNASQLQDAARLSPTEQDAMARGMVDRLAARLATNPRDATGWMRLMRAKLVLGDRAGAAKALADGKAVFRGDAGVTAQLDAAAATLGL